MNIKTFQPTLSTIALQLLSALNNRAVVVVFVFFFQIVGVIASYFAVMLSLPS